MPFPVRINARNSDRGSNGAGRQEQGGAWDGREVKPTRCSSTGFITPHSHGGEIAASEKWNRPRGLQT